MSDQTGMTLYEFAHLHKTSECGVLQKTVLNLDGGGSTSFAIPSLKVYEQVDRCRHLGNILSIQKKH
jgi:exopolysaccharide biosynthesis protein